MEVVPTCWCGSPLAEDPDAAELAGLCSYHAHVYSKDLQDLNRWAEKSSDR
jgi:hypothetical protein